MSEAEGWKRNCQIQLEETHRQMAENKRLQAENARLTKHVDLMAEMLAEIKATHEGRSEQPIGCILKGGLLEIELLDMTEIASKARAENEILRASVKQWTDAFELSQAEDERLRR